MIAGTLGPVASAFSICALSQSWVQHSPPGTGVSDATLVSDPAWWVSSQEAARQGTRSADMVCARLTTVRALQLCLALVSNMFLLLDVTRKVRFTIAEPIAIIGWYASAVCFVCLDAVASGPLLDSLGLSGDDRMWSQAFYYGIWSAVLYFVAASVLAITFWGALHGRRGEDFNLSRGQRTLVLQAMLFLTYLLLGALLFSRLEEWDYLDGVYWADVTLFTIGFGDMVPTTVLGQALLIPYVLVGITSLGIVVSSIRSMIVQRGGQRLDARVDEKSRRNALQKVLRRGKGDMLIPLEGGGEPLADLYARELERRRGEFELMRAIQKRASSRRKWAAMLISTVCWLGLWFCGAVVFFKCEKAAQAWTYFDAVSFCFISLTTVGYGNLVPKSNAGKSFFVFWSLISLPILTILISNAGETVVRVVNDITIRAGSITILPGRGSFRHNLKQLARQLSCGYSCPDSAVDTSFDLEKGTARQHRAPEARAPKLKGRDGPSHGTENGTFQTSVSQSESPVSPRSHPPCQTMSSRRCADICGAELDDNLPTGDDLHLLLVSEIQAVAETIRKDRRRRYTFQDWVWYLRLMGEDERDPDAHRETRPTERPRILDKFLPARTKTLRSRRTSRHRGEDAESGTEQSRQPEEHDTRSLKWSWVGDQSPLISGKEESEWILEMLMERLRALLRESSRQHQDTGPESS
ncbi:potassium channel [Metarhizium album ARSEF 1941]|uniref:Potassium channel n=1 Tax=Metarhizium album (strain ARSEF 1941) TaxID=1081103 RepID=A0A0B2WPN3_METAS|nr:potassium channel [Metarhizium album ARSEF 1941]KHN94950.1 potassium channel [Metarhizium album ARSEF 1941]